MLRSLVVLDFELRKDIIATTLCIQKEVVNNTCQGHCHLMSTLEEVDDAEQAASPDVQNGIRLLPEVSQDLFSFHFFNTPVFLFEWEWMPFVKGSTVFGSSPLESPPRF